MGALPARQEVARPYLSNFCHVGFGITLTESIFRLPSLAQALSIPGPSPFYLNADIAHLPLSTAAARGFLVPKAPFCLLLEASVLPVFMKARAWSLTQAVNPG